MNNNQKIIIEVAEREYRGYAINKMAIQLIVYIGIPSKKRFPYPLYRVLIQTINNTT